MAQVNNDVAIHILLDKNKQLEVTAQKATAPDAIHLCFAAIGAIANRTMELAKGKDKKLQTAIKQDLFDMINVGASSLLDTHFPDIALRPDLTVDAILEAEKELVKDDKKVEKYIKAYAESDTAELDKAIRKEGSKAVAKSKPKPKTKK